MNTYEVYARGGMGNQKLISFSFREERKPQKNLNIKNKCEYCGRHTVLEICSSCGAPLQFNYIEGCD